MESSVQTKLYEGFLEKRSRAYVVAIIPAYNEGYTIASVLINALRYVDKVIVCDDGSVDLTGEIAEKMGATVVRHKTNQGKGAAYKTGLRRAVQDEPDIVVCLDADGQHEPDKIPGLIRPILYDEADLAIGTRFNKDARCEAPFHRRVGLKLIDVYSRRAMGCNVTDSQSGFRAFSSRMFEVMLSIESNGFGLETEQIRVTTDNKFRIKEVPVEIKYKDVPKPSKNNPIAHGVEIIGTITQLVVERRPFLFLGNMVRHHPVDLLGHPPIKAPQPSLHVTHNDRNLHRRQSPTENRVGVPLNQDDASVLPAEKNLLDPSHYPARLLPVAPGTHVKLVLGLKKPQVIEERLIHPIIIVLARVDHVIRDRRPLALPDDG